MTDERADLIQRFLRLARIAVPLTGILLVVLQWWQASILIDQAQAANQTMRQIWTNHPPAFPLDTLGAALYIPTAVSPLAAFDPGEGPWLAQSIWLQITKIARGQDQFGYDVFSVGRQINMSAATFAQLIIPSLALVLAWRQAKAGREISLQSWTTLQTLLIEFAGPTVAICCLLTAILQRQSLGVEGATRLMLILGAYVLYSLCCGTICWLAFQYSDSLSRPMGMLVVFWLLNFTLARPLTVNLASLLFPVPSLDQYAEQLNQGVESGIGGVESRADRQRRFFSEILRDYKVRTSAEVPVNVSALMMMKEETHQRAVGRQLRDQLEATFLKQERLEQVLSVFFPSAAIQITSSALAATDFACERRQLADADVFWGGLVPKVYKDVAETSGPNAVKVERGSDYWTKLPFFESRIPSPFWPLLSCLGPGIGMTMVAAAGVVMSLRGKKPQEEQEA